jgi:hypothetical protein
MAVSLAAVGILSTLISSRQVLSMLLAPIALLMMTIVQASFYPMYRSLFEAE